ncbi:Telomerase Cajal body protein 1 [Tritrichomonas musculus]|uniref:Telomerase Cajal body protein 1 n=1 Tax=Tritrichomonas musculus TaxID=1915356 RepID=A0ABR2KTW7_9EUKA
MNDFSLCDNAFNINFLPRLMKWSPDGSSLIASSFSNNLTIFNKMSMNSIEQEDRTEIAFLNKVDLTFPKAVTNYSWYPLMNFEDPSSCCFACIVPFQPIQLVDSNSGRIRSMYHCQYNNYPASLTSVVFNGGSLLAGGTRTLFECPIQRSGCLGKPVIECPGSVMTITSHPVSAYLALGISTGDIVFIDSRNYQVIFSDKFHNHAVDQIAWTNSSSFSSQDIVFLSARLENEVIGLDTRMPNIPITVIETKRNTSRIISLSCSNYENDKCFLFVGNEEEGAKVLDIKADTQLLGSIGNGPTPLAVYNKKMNVVAVASGKHEIIENEYDYSDDDNEKNIEVTFEPKLNSFQIYIRKK